jgi:hypothetical protein
MDRVCLLPVICQTGPASELASVMSCGTSSRITHPILETSNHAAMQRAEQQSTWPLVSLPHCRQDDACASMLHRFANCYSNSLVLRAPSCILSVAALGRASSAASTKRKARYPCPQLLGQDRHDIMDLSNQIAKSAQIAVSCHEHQHCKTRPTCGLFHEHQV